MKKVSWMGNYHRTPVHEEKDWQLLSQTSVGCYDFTWLDQDKTICWEGEG